MSDIKKQGNRMQILPKPERLGGLLFAENKDEAVSLGHLSYMGVTAPHKIYRALISQSGTDAPVTSAIFENTIGDIVWTYSSEGVYVGTLTGAFSTSKTTSCIGNNGFGFIAVYANDANTVRIATATTAGVAGNDILLGSITIITYY